jgi:hypothetical protein
MRGRGLRRRGVVVIAIAAATLASFLPSAAAGSPSVSEVASGLNSPRGLAFGGGALLVAEAGKGGHGACGPGPLGETCIGRTGAITHIVNGHPNRLVDLPSLASPDGSAAFGTHDVGFGSDGAMYATIGLAGTPEIRDSFGPRGRLLGHLVRTNGSGGVQAVADLTAYEAKHDPDGLGVESDPYGLLPQRGYSIVTDAAANDLLKVTNGGHVSTLAVFPDRLVDFRGDQVPMQAVPTSVVRGPDGALYVSQLTGFPFPRGGARIFRVEPGHRPQVYARGFTNVIDIAFDDAGNLYVLEIAHNSLRSDTPYGELLRMAPSGDTTVVIGKDENLFFPTSVLLEHDGNLLVTNCGVCAGGGQVLEVTP